MWPFKLTGIRCALKIIAIECRFFQVNYQCLMALASSVIIGFLSILAGVLCMFTKRSQEAHVFRRG